jgi:hypothetical protein
MPCVNGTCQCVPFGQSCAQDTDCCPVAHCTGGVCGA